MVGNCNPSIRLKEQTLRRLIELLFHRDGAESNRDEPLLLGLHRLGDVRKRRRAFVRRWASMCSRPL